MCPYFTIWSSYCPSQTGGWGACKAFHTSPCPLLASCPKAILNHRAAAEETIIIYVQLISHPYRKGYDQNTSRPTLHREWTILKALTLSAAPALSVNNMSLFQSLGQCTISLSVDVLSVCVSSLKSLEPFPHSGIHKEPGYSKMCVRKTCKTHK